MDIRIVLYNDRWLSLPFRRSVHFLNDFFNRLIIISILYTLMIRTVYLS